MHREDGGGLRRRRRIQYHTKNTSNMTHPGAYMGWWGSIGKFQETDGSV